MRQWWKIRVPQHVRNATGEVLVEDVGDWRGQAPAVVAGYRDGCLAILASAAVVDQVVPQCADGAHRAVTKRPVDATTQVSKLAKVMLQRAHQGCVVRLTIGQGQPCSLVRQNHDACS